MTDAELTETLLALLHRGGPLPPEPQGPTLPPELSEARGAAAWRRFGEAAPRWDDDRQAYHEGYNAAADEDDAASRPWVPARAPG